MSQTLSSSTLSYVLINDMSQRLDGQPVPFFTGVDGCLRIVVQATSELATPTITATVKGSNRDYTFTLEPRQRLLAQWGNIKSGQDIKNAKSTAKNPVFSNSKISDDTFAAVADLLNNVPHMVSAVDKQASDPKQNVASFSTNAPAVLSFERTEQSVTALPHSWTSAATDVVHSVGDFLQAIWHGVLSIAKFAIKVTSGVVNFFAEIAGKVFRFVLNTVGSVIRRYARRVCRRSMC